MAASSENSRITRFFDCPRNGTSASSDARKTYQIIEPTDAMPCCIPGVSSVTATDTFSSSHVPPPR